MHHHQPTALAFGGQPQALPSGVDGNAFEQRIEVQQHATGTGLADQAVRQAQPVGGAVRANLQHGGMGFAEQVAVAGGITGDAFQVQLVATEQVHEPGARAHAPGQATGRRRRCLKGFRARLQDAIHRFQHEQTVINPVGHALQRLATHRQAGQVAAVHAHHRVLGHQP